MSVLIDVVETMGPFIVQWSWQLALFIAFLALIVGLDRRHRPMFRYRLWSLALVATLLLAWLPQLIASYSWTIRVKEVLTDPRATASAPVGTETDVAIVKKAQGDNIQFNSVKSSSANQVQIPAPSRSAVPYRVAGVLWAMGVATGLCWRVREHWRIRRIVARSNAVPCEDLVPFTNASSLMVLLSTEVRNPMLYGLFRPKILLPSDIMAWTTPDERARILRHEDTHFTQKHHWFASLEGVLKVALFFHPLFHWMCRQLDAERELVCDAEIIRQGTDADTYAETLLLVAEHAVAGRPGVYFAARTHLNRRIEFLFRPFARSRIAVMAAPLILVMPLLPIGFWHARIQAVAPLESRLETRFVPPLPVEALTKRPVLTTPRPPEVQENPVSKPAPPQAPRVRMSIMTLRGQGVANEVGVTVEIPYALQHFSQQTTPSGTAYMQNRSHIAVDIARLTGQKVAQTNEPVQISILRSVPADGSTVIQKVFLIEPGAYSISVQVTDDTTGAAPGGMILQRLEVPSLSHGGLGLSSLVLADLIEPLPPRVVSGMFVIGNLKVRPNVSGEFRRSQSLNLFQQVYGTSAKPLAYEARITTNGQETWRMAEEIVSSSQVPVTRTVPLSDFAPGNYEIRTSVIDPVTGEKVLSNARFSVQ